MKNILCILCSVCLLAGCSVYRIEAPNAVQNTDVTLHLILYESAAPFLDTAASRYQDQNPSIDITITRYPDDETYRANLVSRLREEAVTGFAVHGTEDAAFFRDDLAPLPESLSSFSLSDDLPAAPIALYGCGVWYREDLLKSSGVDPACLGSLEGLQSAVSLLLQNAAAIGISYPVCRTTDLAPLAATVNCKDGVPDSSIASLTQLAGKGAADDPSRALTEGSAAIYLGSDRLIQSALRGQAAQAIRFSPIPYENSSYLVSDMDWLCFSNSATQPQQDALATFFNWLPTQQDFPLSPLVASPSSDAERSLSDAYHSSRMLHGLLGEMPILWKQTFDTQTEALRNGEISWQTYTDQLSGCFSGYANLDS